MYLKVDIFTNTVLHNMILYVSVGTLEMFINKNYNCTEKLPEVINCGQQLQIVYDLMFF